MRSFIALGEGVLEVPRQPGGRRGLISHRVVAARVKGIGAGNEPVSAIKASRSEEKVVRSGRGRKGADPPESDCAVGRADIGCRLAVEEPAAFFISGVRFKLIFEFEPNSPAAAERFSAFETEREPAFCPLIIWRLSAVVPSEAVWE